MTGWTEQQLTAIGNADELRIAPAQTDGTLRREVIIWVVRVGDDIYIRSANGRDAAWYRHTAATGHARITAGGVAADVTAEDASGNDTLTAALQAEYHRKYDHYGESVTRGALSPEAQDATWRLLPR